MQKTYGKYIALWLLVCGAVIISFAYTPSPHISIDYQSYFAILPHFGIQPAIIDDAYQNILENYALSGKSLQIVLISPDHFSEWKTTLKHTLIDHDMCFQNICLPIHEIFSSDHEDINNNRTKEHGRWAHFSFITKYFPNAKVSLVRLSPRNFIALDTLYTQLHQLEKNDNLLVIASVDFSHYISEKRAYLHDLKSYYTLANSPTQSSYKSIEADCPTCLYLINTRANNEYQYPQLLYRDSSSTIEHKDLGNENTSREFILYTPKKSEENGIVLWFFGDLMFDRWVKLKLNTPEKIQNHFQSRYQQNTTWLDPKNNIHRPGFGLDILWYNLETPFVNTTCIRKTNGINMCSSWAILWILQSLGFNTVTIANNHMRDDGYAWYMQTINNLQTHTIDYAGWTHFKGINKNVVLTKNIRGIPLALHAYDLYNRFSGDVDGYCLDLTDYHYQWYRNIVSIHRWTEYQTIHNRLQENIGKKLIDCWADIIVGHHPHVVQDIQRYQGKPIIYSLWNFLFDQYFSEATQKGMYVLAHIPLSWDIEIWTGEVTAIP